MSILSGIKFVTNLATHGKLIGVAKKSGIKVFEKIDEYGCKHITSIGRDGNVRKKILKAPDIETVVDNFVTGERVNIRSGKTSFSLTRRSENGDVEYYYRSPERVSLVFGEGPNRLDLSVDQCKHAGKLFSMSNAKHFNLNGVTVPPGVTVAKVGKDGIIEKIVKDIQTRSHDKDLVKSVYDAVSKLFKL